MTIIQINNNLLLQDLNVFIDGRVGGRITLILLVGFYEKFTANMNVRHDQEKINPEPTHAFFAGLALAALLNFLTSETLTELSELSLDFNSQW